MTERAALESKIAHLERTLEEVSDVVATQSARIDALERRVRMLLERAAEAEYAGGSSVPLADQKPPHY